MMPRWFFLLIISAYSPALLASQVTDQEATDTIQSATTDERFLTDWVATLPEHDSVPSPREVLGYTIGTPGELTHVDDIHRYFEMLASASPRVMLTTIGKSQEGRDMLLAVISSESNLARVDEIKAINRQLADARRVSADAAKALIADSKPVYWITAGLHSPELGPPETMMELAYRLAVDESPLFKKIRDEVVVLITPVLETDGRARQVEWYRRHLKNFTDYEDTPPRSPPYWGHYTFHDNNRDGLTFSQPLTRNYVAAFFDWLPTLSLDLHESVPLLYVSTGTGPYNEAVDPITITEWQAIANYEVNRLTGKGMPGVWTWGFYTGWFPGYLLWVTNNHNTNGRFYETFGNASANTMERDLTHSSFAGNKITDKTWYRSIPPERKLTWSMRNNVNFMQSGVIASLEMVANNATMFMENFYRKSVNALERGISEAPYAFSIPATQRDSAAAQYLVDTLKRHGIEVMAADQKFVIDEDRQIAKGDAIILLNQPYGPLAKNLLEKQKFPPDVQVPPYDDVAWTLGLQFGVDVVAVDDRSILDISTRELPDAYFGPERVIEGRGRYLVVGNRAQSTLGPFRFAIGDVPVSVAEDGFSVGSHAFGPGSLVIDTQGHDRDRVTAALAANGLSGVATRNPPRVPSHPADLQRIGVFQSWMSTQNAGWVRYSLDEAGIPFTLITKDRIRQGQLRDEFDVLLVPSFWGRSSLASIIGGIDTKWSPLPYTRTADTPSHGLIASSEDITGGIGFEGMQAIADFIESGGTFVGLADGGVLAADSGIVRDIGYSNGGSINSPGSIITSKVLSSHPLTWGYEQWTHVFKGNGPSYTVRDYNRHLVVMQFGSKVVPQPDDALDSPGADEPAAPPLVLSGAILGGADQVDGAPALLHAKVGEGNVVLFGWNPLHRNINHHDHAFLYNSLLNWNDLPVPQRHQP
jgi:hypothetical protein